MLVFAIFLLMSGFNMGETGWVQNWLPWWPDASFRSSTEIQKSSPLDSPQVFVQQLLEAKDGTDDEVNSTSTEIGKTNLMTNEFQSIESPPSQLDNKHQVKSSLSEFTTQFSDLSECPRNCSRGLEDALGFVLKEMSHVERYHLICKSFDNAWECVNADANCADEDKNMFGTLTSGIKYMCVDQQLAFNATIQCIDNEAAAVQSECEAQCQTRNFFLNWLMRSTMQSTIQQGVNGIVGAATGNGLPANIFAIKSPESGFTEGQTFIDNMQGVNGEFSQVRAQQQLETFKQFTGDLCKIGDCALDCLRNKFNARCEGSAGTLLSEVFVRPIAAGQDKLAVLGPVLGIFVPDQCSYLYNGAELSKHRIDNNMDKELRRMYSEKNAKENKEKSEEDEALSKLVPLSSDGIPLTPFSSDIDSPLDTFGHDFEQRSYTEKMDSAANNSITFSDYPDNIQESSSPANVTQEENDSDISEYIAEPNNTTAVFEYSGDGEIISLLSNSTNFTDVLENIEEGSAMTNVTQDEYEYDFTEGSAGTNNSNATFDYSGDGGIISFLSNSTNFTDILENIEEGSGMTNVTQDEFEYDFTEGSAGTNNSNATFDYSGDGGIISLLSNSTNFTDMLENIEESSGMTNVTQDEYEYDFSEGSADTNNSNATFDYSGDGEINSLLKNSSGFIDASGDIKEGADRSNSTTEGSGI